MANVIFPSALVHRHAFTPSWAENEKPKPVFFFRAGSFADRAQYLADIEVECGPEVYQFQKDMVFQEGLESLLPDREDQPDNAADRARIMEIMANSRAGETVSAAEAATFEKAWNVVEQHWPALKELKRRESLRFQLQPMLAMMHFCVGLENVKDAGGEFIEFETDDLGRMKDSVLLSIDPGTLLFAGNFAHNLQYGLSAEKNSAPRSKSGAKGKRSKAAT